MSRQLLKRAVAEPMLRIRTALCHELAALERRARGLAQENEVCWRFMPMPGSVPSWR